MRLPVLSTAALPAAALPAAALLAAALVLPCAGSARASSCLEEIATLSKRLDSAGARKVAGEPTAGATAPGTDKALPKPPGTKPSDPDAKPTASGVEEARKLLDTASAQEKAGDAKACRDTVMKAKESAGALP